jgi:H+/Cl- antiporter ClcA
MILTPSEVALLARKASFWEFAEYISEALVGIGCFGEYIAEYAKWPAKWTEEQKHRLGRRSLILLIIGIGAGLLSLIQTNALYSRA